MPNKRKEFHPNNVEEVKGCQMADSSIGRVWQGEKRESLEPVAADRVCAWRLAPHLQSSLVYPTLFPFFIFGVFVRIAGSNRLHAAVTEACCMESLLVVYLCVPAIPNRCQRTVLAPVRG